MVWVCTGPYCQCVGTACNLTKGLMTCILSETVLLQSVDCLLLLIWELSFLLEVSSYMDAWVRVPLICGLDVDL